MGPLQNIFQTWALYDTFSRNWNLGNSHERPIKGIFLKLGKIT